MADLGFDYILFDTEHSPWNIEAVQTAVMAFRGSETVPMARVPWNDPVTIKRYLDCGIEGILSPMVRTPDEAEALVAACRYPPDGTRGFGPRRASNYYRDLKTYVERANDAIFVMPQIEDIKTVDMLDAFMNGAGLDAIRRQGEGSLSRQDRNESPISSKVTLHRLDYGDRMEHRTLLNAGDQIFVPADLPHAPCNSRAKLIEHMDRRALMLVSELIRMLLIVLVAKRRSIKARNA